MVLPSSCALCTTIVTMFTAVLSLATVWCTSTGMRPRSRGGSGAQAAEAPLASPGNSNFHARHDLLQPSATPAVAVNGDVANVDILQVCC